MFGRVITAAICGIESCKVAVEADVSEGMPTFSMVGFLASEVREAQDRVRTALKNSGIALPVKRITVNLAPADVRKSGSGFDLPIAVAVLAALGYVPQDSLEGILFVGELSLNGDIHRARGVLEMVSSAAVYGCRTCVVPEGNLSEGSVIRGIRVLGAESLQQVLKFLTGTESLKENTINIEEIRSEQEENAGEDFADIQGQAVLRRACEVAVSGMHNLLMVGPPGAGKTMTAKRIPTILPSTSMEEALEISKIYSIAGMLPEEVGLMTRRPFRAPHHTVTPVALAGGGKTPRPGEVSLAHRLVIDLLGLADLLENAVLHDHDPVGDGHGFILVVGDEYGGDAGFPLDALDFLTGLQSQPGVKIGQRFVKEKHLRHFHKGARNGDSLLLTAGELRGFSVHESVNLHQLCNLQRLFVHLVLGHSVLAPEIFQREDDVLPHGEMGVEGVILEHQTHAAVFRGQSGHVIVAEDDFAGGGFEKSADEVERGAFSASGGTEKPDQLAVRDGEIEIVHSDHIGLDLFVPVGEFFRQILQYNFHGSTSSCCMKDFLHYSTSFPDVQDSVMISGKKPDSRSLQKYGSDIMRYAL